MYDFQNLSRRINTSGQTPRYLKLEITDLKFVNEARRGIHHPVANKKTPCPRFGGAQYPRKSAFIRPSTGSGP